MQDTPPEVEKFRCRAKRGLIAGRVCEQHQEKVDIRDPGVISTAATLHHLKQVVR